jgi:hypothetical protein
LTVPVDKVPGVLKLVPKVIVLEVVPLVIIFIHNVFPVLAASIFIVHAPVGVNESTSHPLEEVTLITPEVGDNTMSPSVSSNVNIFLPIYAALNK